MEPTLSDFVALDTIKDEINNRRVLSSKVKVMYYKSPDPLDIEQIINPGCIGLFVGYQNDPLLDELADAIESKDHPTIKSLSTRLRNNASLQARVDLNTAVNDMLAKGSFAELQYCKKTLVTNLFVPSGALLCPWALPYIGGVINGEDFDFIQYIGDKDTDILSAIIILHEPNLSIKETNILQRLPASHDSLKIGNAICWGLSAVTLAVAVSGATGVCCPHDGLGSQAGWTDPRPEWLENLNDDPIIAAKELLKFRRDNLRK